MDTPEVPPVVNGELFSSAAVCWLFAALIPACIFATAAFLWLTRIP